MRIGKQEWFDAVMPGGMERLGNGPARGGKCVPIGDDCYRLPSENLAKNLRRFFKSMAADFEGASVPGRGQRFGQGWFIRS
jgi:hypothetical protein